MKILYLTTVDPREHQLLWAGTALSILNGMEKMGHQVRVHTIGNTSVHFYGALRWRAHRWWNDTQFAISFDPIDLWFNRRRLAKELRGVEYDLVFAWLPWQLDLLETDKPKVFWYDTTFIKTQPMYYGNLWRFSVRRCIALDARIARQAAAAVYCSEWARQSAISDYGANPARVHRIPFGANMEGPPFEQVQSAIQARLNRRGEAIRLLFVGIDWERKGGQTAVEVAREINKRGVPARLTIVGCRPDLSADDLKFTDIVGRLNKQNPPELERIRSLYLQSDYFIMTSRGESFGIVYCEAMACGLPCLATRTGGVEDIVRNGVTGFITDTGTNTAIDLANAVISNHADPAAYSALMESAYQAYKLEFNWAVSWTRFDNLLQDAISR